MAPELTLRKDYSGEKVDMWAAGVVMYALLTGQLPFMSSAESSLFRKIQSGIYPIPKNKSGHIVSIQARDLLKTLLTIDPNHRISAEKALLHPWITKNKLLSSSNV